MDCLSPSNPIEKVVFMKGAQIGGTEAGNNWVGYTMDQAPGPMLVVQPTVEMGKRWSKGRLAPLIEDTPCLRGKVKDPRSRDSGNTVQSKEFQGGIVVVTGANSAIGLRSMPVRYLFLDEVDAYPGDADGEGDPVALAIQRTATFARRKIFLVSTPTIQGLSRIEMEYANSDQRKFYVPCPHCGEMQTLVWSQVHFDDGVYYACRACHQRIDECAKTDMLKNGRWIAQYPDRSVAGFHLSSLYSPVGWFSWQQAVVNFQQAQKNETLLKVWVNTTLGEPWVDRGEAPDWERLYERAEDYPRGIVPQGGLVLTAGVDVQKDRLECEIVAYGLQKESWSVDYIVIPHSPASPEAWQQLQTVLERVYPVAGSSADSTAASPMTASPMASPPMAVSTTVPMALPISMMAVDAGYATQEVYNWVRQQNPYRVIAVKGVDKALTPLGAPTRVEVNVGGRKLARGLKLWPVGVSLLKSELFAWLKQSRHPEDGSRLGAPRTGVPHFPKYDPEYFKQLTAEQLVTKTVKGYAKREWQKLRERNEALDCRVYARAASLALGMDRWSAKQWAQLQRSLVQQRPATQSATAAAAVLPSETATEQATSPAETARPAGLPKPANKRPRIVRSAWIVR